MAFQKFTLLSLLSVVTLTVTSTPIRLVPRIAQTIADSTAEWEQACLKAGGALQCNPQSQASFMTLLAAADACDQQDQADKMIDLAKTLNNDAEMIRLTQIFVQQPRNSPNSVAIPYCQKEAKNAEIKGLFQCQFKSANQQQFANGNAVGGAGTVPFGLSGPLNPLGSCKAHPEGPVDDGQQLVKLVQDPGVGNDVGASAGNSTSTANGNSTEPATAETGNATATATAAAAPTASATDSADTDSGLVPAQDGDTSFPGTSSSNSTSTDDGDTDFPGSDSSATATGAATPASATASDTTTNTASSAPSATAASTGDFRQQNGKDAQAQNAGFAKLTKDSSCQEGDQACIDGGFAQCVGGKFSIQACAGGTQCFALPLVNKPGTSIACTTQDDASARIAATGATGGIMG